MVTGEHSTWMITEILDTPFKTHRAPSWITMTQENTEWMIMRP